MASYSLSKEKLLIVPLVKLFGNQSSDRRKGVETKGLESSRVGVTLDQDDNSKQSLETYREPVNGVLTHEALFVFLCSSKMARSCLLRLGNHRPYPDWPFGLHPFLCNECSFDSFHDWLSFDPACFGCRFSNIMGFRKYFLWSISYLWFALASTDPLSLFNHRYLTECRLLEETTSRHQWKIVFDKKRE